MSKQPNPTPKEIGAMKPPAPPSPPFPYPHPLREVIVCGNCGNELEEIAASVLFKGEIVKTFVCFYCKRKITDLENQVVELKLQFIHSQR